MTATKILNAPDLNQDDYLVIGLATCFVREDGEISEVTVVEPVPSAYLEAIFKGVPTAYRSLHGVTLGQVVSSDSFQLPADLPADAQLCENFNERCIASARTFYSRPEAKGYVPLGSSRTDINYSTAKKRILNAENIVSPEDNVKQHSHTHKVL